MDGLIQWLMEGPPWVQYRTLRDLRSLPADDSGVSAAHQAMLEHPQVLQLLAELAGWPVAVLSSHKSAGHALHKLAFVADLGLQVTDPGIGTLAERIMAQQDSAGPFQVLMNIPAHFGGSGTDQWAWALCDAPLVVYALLKMGLGEDERVQAAASYLAGLVRDNGWPCAVSPELGSFRGPGRKDDPCPYASLVMLKCLALVPAYHDSPATRFGTEALLTLWEQRRDRHPYMFFMGTDFCKIKAPLVWYDLVHVLDVLSQFEWLRGDARFQAMLDVLNTKADAEGRFTPESIWTAWKDWDFGQKREPSRWLTLLAHRILKRASLHHPVG